MIIALSGMLIKFIVLIKKNYIVNEYIESMQMYISQSKYYTLLSIIKNAKFSLLVMYKFLYKKKFLKRKCLIGLQSRLTVIQVFQIFDIECIVSLVIYLNKN